MFEDMNIFEEDLFKDCKTIDEIHTKRDEIITGLEIEKQRKMMEMTIKHNKAMGKLGEVSDMLDAYLNEGIPINTGRIRELLNEALEINKSI